MQNQSADGVQEVLVDRCWFKINTGSPFGSCSVQISWYLGFSNQVELHHDTKNEYMGLFVCLDVGLGQAPRLQEALFVCLDAHQSPASTVLKAPWSLATGKQNPVSFLPGAARSILLSAIIAWAGVAKVFGPPPTTLPGKNTSRQTNSICTKPGPTDMSPPNKRSCTSLGMPLLY